LCRPTTSIIAFRKYSTKNVIQEFDMTTRFRLSMPAALLGVALVLASCTCKIKEEQLSQIRQIRTQDKETAAEISKVE